jgi:hypothetical protein
MGAFEDARDELYGLDPDAFLARRTELAAAARTDGDALAAKQIGALRKPTRSAYAVNLLVRAEPDAAAELERIGDELRAAQQALDGAAMRELSTSRNKLVDRLARAALTAAGKGAPAALRDEIAATLGAAIADPDVLDRLREGALVRAERWDGIGVATGPALRLVQGDKRERTGSGGGKAAGLWPAPASGSEDTQGAGDSEDDEDAAATVTARSASDERARARRQAKLEAAEAALAQAEQAMDASSEEVSTARREVRRLEDDLDEARRRLDEAEHGLRRARDGVDKARAALDRVTQRS